MKPFFVLLRYVSRPELASRPVRSVLMMGTVAVGVALLTAMHVATDSIVTGFASDLERLAGKADLQVTFGTGEAGFSEELLGKIQAQPFVAEAAALIHSQVSFVDGEPETVELFGIDLMQEHVLSLYEVEVLERDEGDFVVLDDPRGIFITNVVARDRALHLGSKVRLAAVDGVHEYTVHGIVATKGLAGFLGGRLIAMYLPAAQPVAGRRGDFEMSMIDQIDIRLNDGADIDASRAALQNLLAPGFHANTPVQRRLMGQHTVDGLRATLVGMSSLALLAAVFIIYASTTTMVVERLPAMATLMTLGAGPQALIRAIVGEVSILGVFGSASGVALGLMLSGFIGNDAAAGMGLNYSIPFDSTRISFDPLLVFVVHPLGGIATAALSAYLPARRLRMAAPIPLQRDAETILHRSMLSFRWMTLIAVVPMAAGVAAISYGVTSHSAEMVSLGGISIIAACVLFMLPVLKRLWFGAAGPLEKIFGAPGRIAGANLARTLDRSLVTASAITLSVAIAVGAGTLVQSFRASVANWYGFSGDALVSSRSMTGGWLAAPVSRDLETPLRQLASVADVQTLRVIQGQPYRGERIAIASLSSGLLGSAVEEGRSLLDSMADAKARLADGSGVAVSENFVSHFGLPPPGTPLVLATTSGEVRLPIVAVVPDYVSDQGSVLVSRDVVISRWNDGAVNYFAVRLRPDSTVSSLTSDVQRQLLESHALSVMPTQHMVDRVDGFIAEAFADIDTIKLLVLFLTAVGIGDLVVSNVLSRRRELAILQVVGLTRSQVVQTTRLESLCVTVSAAVCGILVGAVCAWIWVQYNYPALVGYVLRLSIAWSAVVVSLVVSAITAYVASTFAARYALRSASAGAMRID
jgi:putative ABC transport system permease protein